jgi:hypothetical protein
MQAFRQVRAVIRYKSRHKIGLYGEIWVPGFLMTSVAIATGYGLLGTLFSPSFLSLLVAGWHTISLLAHLA